MMFHLVLILLDSNQNNYMYTMHRHKSKTSSNRQYSKRDCVHLIKKAPVTKIYLLGT